MVIMDLRVPSFHCTHVRYVAMSRCHHITSEPMWRLARMPSLKGLNLIGCYQQVRARSQHCPPPTTYDFTTSIATSSSQRLIAPLGHDTFLCLSPTTHDFAALFVDHVNDHIWSYAMRRLIYLAIGKSANRYTS